MTEGFREQRQRALRQIVASLKFIDEYNVTHEDSKILDKDKLIFEVMKEYEVSLRTATEWVNEAIEMNKTSSYNMLKLEKQIRGD